MLLLNHERKPLKSDGTNTKRNQSTGINAEAANGLTPDTSQQLLEHDLDLLGDLDDMPSAKISKYVQSNMQSELNSQRMENF